MTELAAVANTSRKSYYIWLKKRQIKTQREIENAKILAAIRQIEKRHLSCAGYRKVTTILNSDTSKIKEYTLASTSRLTLNGSGGLCVSTGLKLTFANRVVTGLKNNNSTLKTMYYIANLPLTSPTRSG